MIIFHVEDQSGKVRIWDTVNKEHILKNEFQPISGPIKDLSWSSDNQRMVVVGEGREKLEFFLIIKKSKGIMKKLFSCSYKFFLLFLLSDSVTFS